MGNQPPVDNRWYELGMAACHLAAGSIMQRTQSPRTSAATRLLLSDGGLTFPRAHINDIRRAVQDFLHETGQFCGLKGALVANHANPDRIHILLAHEPVAPRLMSSYGNDNSPSQDF